MDLKSILAPYDIEVQEHEVLEGYASTNYRIRVNGVNYLLKYYSDSSEFELISQEESMLKLLSSKALPFQVPIGLKDMFTYPDASFSRLLPFIEGELLSSVGHTDELLFNFGKSVGLINKHLMDEKNSVIQSRELFWDMKHTLLNEEKIDFIDNPHDKKIVTYFFDLFEHQVLPKQRKLRHGIIHSDLNDNNVIVEGDEVKGIIDFGDITHTPLIYEVAIALTYIMLANEDSPFEKANAFLRGYHSELPLLEEELELLQLLIPSRLCVSVCNSAKKKAEGEDTEYVLVSERPAWNLLHTWISINPIWITNFFLDAVGLAKREFDIDSVKSDRKNYTGSSLGTSYKDPIYMTGAAFQYMYDHVGNTYLDAYNNIPHVGHCHPNISKTISKHVRALNTNTRYLYPELTDYSKELSHTLPETLRKVFYLNSGSAASDAAIRMAQTHTGNHSVAILENGYHGNTMTGIAISDYKHNGKGGQGKSENIITLPLPKSFQGKFETGKQYAQHAIQELKKHISEGNSPCAFIVEPVSGCGGQVPLASGYLQALSPFLKEQNILLIIDEVQTGFGRLGSYFWGFEMHGVTPDILILGKPMGNGHPIAALITASEIADSFANGMEFFSSFGGNPVSCAIASEVLKTIQQEELQEHAKQVSAFLKKGLLKLKTRFNSIADVRGEGLFLGIEFLNSDGSPGTEIAGLVKEKLKENFILVGTDGPFNNVIKIKPPMCFSVENAEHFLAKLESVLSL